MNKSFAFALVELIIVLIIIGILASLALVQYNNVVEKARSAEAFSTLAEIVAAENRYLLEKDRYTLTITDLDAFDATPISANFTFSIGSIDTSLGYAQAARRCPAAGCGSRKSYGMCLKSGKQGTPCSGDTCNPGCP